VKLGKVLNVQRIVMGTVGKLFGSYMVSVRVVNVETGQVVFSRMAKGKDELELTSQLKALAEDIAKVPSTPQAVVPVAPPKPPVPVARFLNLAVGELQPQGLSGSDAAMVSAILRNEIVQTRAFSVVERSEMERVMNEQAFQRTGCTSDECAVKLGKLLNVQRIVMGTVGKLFESYMASVRVVDVETGRVVFSEMAKGKDELELTAELKRVAEEMAKQVR
jgi:curli biogenesis system outer membrane secretion channel CsgG